MVRMRFYFTPALGRFNDARQWAEDLGAACRGAGCAPGRMWAKTVGPVNDSVLEYEYDSISAWEADQARFSSSPEVMAVFRRGKEVTEPGTHPWTEVWEEAPTLA